MFSIKNRVYDGINNNIKNISTVRLPIRFCIVLSRNLSLVFSLISTHKVPWDDITQGKTALTGTVMFDMQFIVTSRLSREKHNVLRILRKNAERSDVERFLLEA